MYKLLVTLVALGWIARPTQRRAVGCKWVESEYRDDVSITTCDGVSVISVRAMSLGRGACAVEIREPRTYGGRVGITALPGVWSGWTPLQNHLGVYHTKIENIVKCDTGVRTQVRYSAPTE
jgi:hypothetical protein